MKSTEDTPKEVLLWTNPNPTSVFSAQTLDVDLSQYDYVKIIYNETSITNKDGISYFKILDIPTSLTTHHQYGICDSGGSSAIDIYGRCIWNNNGKIAFSDAKYGGNVTNTYCIPKRIYGIKGKRIPTKFPTDEYLLWTNSSPSSYGGGDNVCKIDDYDYIKIEHKYGNNVNYNYFKVSEMPIVRHAYVDDYKGCGLSYAQNTSNIRCRPVGINSSGYLAFFMGLPYTNGAYQNDACVPQKVWGIGKK